MSETATVVQMIRNDNASARRLVGLSESQKNGTACLVCGGEGATEPVGWIEGTVQVKVHDGHHENCRLGEFTAPGVHLV
jgi:hypothetical protein